MADEIAPVPAAPPPTPAKARRRSSLARNAEEAFFTGASGAVQANDVSVGVARVRRGIRMAAPHLTAALIDKAMRGKKSPVDREACKFLLKGSGVMQDSAPITEKERLRQEKEIADLETMPAEDLRATIFREAYRLDNRASPVPEEPR